MLSIDCCAAAHTGPWPELSHTGRAGTNGYSDVAKRPPYLSVWCWGGLPGGDWCWGWRGRGGVGWQLKATWVTICEGTTPRRAVQGAPGPGACGRAAGLQFGGAGWWPWVHARPDTSCWEIGTSLETWLVLNTSASRGLAHAQLRVSGEPWAPGYRSGLGMPPSKHSSGQGRGLSMTRSI